jgi:lipopolysaccharide biosynthesis regulator YciM
MRLKTAVIIGFLLLLLIVLVAVVSLNAPLLRLPFNLFGIQLPTAWVLALALLIGFLSFAIWLALSGIAHVARRWLKDLRQQSERVAEEHYLKGLDAILGSRPLEAINHFQHALEAQSNYLPAQLKLGDALRSAGRPQEALTWHRAALNEHSEDVPTLYALVDDSLALRDHEEAKKYLWEILRFQPKRALKALRILRDLYIQEGNWRKALEIQERIGEARVLEEERAADAPFTPGLLYQIGVDLLAREKYSDAIQQFEKVRKKYPFFISTYHKLAEAFLLVGRAEDAVDAFLDGYRRTNSPTCLLAMEQFYLEKGDPEGAVRQYQNLIGSTDRKVLPKFLLGRLYYRLEVLDRAEALLKEIEGNISQSGLLQYYLGRIRERRGHASEACGHYREVIRILNPFELNYACHSCGEVSPTWRDYCPSCLRWDTYAPSFKDDLMQEIQEPSPIFYQEIQWKPRPDNRSF